MVEPPRLQQEPGLMLMGEIYPNTSRGFIQAAPDDPYNAPITAEIPVSPKKHFIVAVDFGTTFSSVSIYCQRDGQSDIDPSQINSIGNYPGIRSTWSQGPSEVPTQSWYPRNMSHRESLENEINIVDEDDSDEAHVVGDDEQMTDSHVQNGDHDDSSHIDRGEDVMDVEDDEYGFGDDDLTFERYYWGYEVSKILAANDTHREQSRYIIRSKLLLDDSKHTKHIRKQLSTTVKELRARKIIRDDTDIIANFLAHLLGHTKSQIEYQYGYNQDSSIEFVLCIPVVWTEKARRRMQSAMIRGLRESEFIENSNHKAPNLFIVTEPEAASTLVLKTTGDVTPGDCFVLLDAGGGTVDAITYKVASRHPLRLEREVIEPEGALCGSSYLNEEYEKLLWRRLASHHELEKGGVTIQGKINELVYDFETNMKRSLDIYGDNFKGEKVTVSNLEPREGENYMIPNKLKISKKEFMAIYKGCLDGVSNLLFSQLQKAEHAGVVIGKVILIGGFASSPSLKRHIEKQLEDYSEQQGRRIPLRSSHLPNTAVSHGAVLRAANKIDGPERIVRSSYGILRTEPYEPLILPAHSKAYPWTDPIDGNKYIKNAIDWIINKGELLPSGKSFTREASHTFEMDPDVRLICQEILFVSSKSHESHYRRKHENNKGCEEAGSILVDMTFLKDDPNFRPVYPGPGEKGKPHYLVEFELVITINDRNLRFEAKYPAGENGVVMAERQISIAASFEPGTE